MSPGPEENVIEVEQLVICPSCGKNNYDENDPNADIKATLALNQNAYTFEQCEECKKAGFKPAFDEHLLSLYGLVQTWVGGLEEDETTGPQVGGIASGVAMLCAVMLKNIAIGK